jgi:hypothetical protein
MCYLGGIYLVSTILQLTYIFPVPASPVLGEFYVEYVSFGLAYISTEHIA